MIAEVSKSADKDIEKLTEEARAIVLGELKRLQIAKTLGSMGNVIKMKGKKRPAMYRLSIDTYRIMIEKLDTYVVIRSVSHRKDAYKKKK